MPRLASHRLPKLRRQSRDNGLDLAFVALDGKRRYLGAWGSVEAEAEYRRLTAEWQLNGRRLPEHAPTTPERDALVEDVLADFWLRFKERYVKDGGRTSEQYRIRSALRPVRRLYGHLPASRFDDTALRTCRAEFVAAGLCRRTCNEYAGYIRAAFRHGVGRKMAPMEVLESLRLSHIVVIKTQVRDPIAVEAACRRLGLAASGHRHSASGDSILPQTPDILSPCPFCK